MHNATVILIDHRPFLCKSPDHGASLIKLLAGLKPLDYGTDFTKKGFSHSKSPLEIHLKLNEKVNLPTTSSPLPSA
jgi:hypothetical protein